nr:hypothetical protein [Nitrosopumilaceae archaeon]NIU88707.1 hypothetical protein [Nitrosopumilaceae archaeon]NIX60404.1 hypothetical protein [Nitrosopumilaceae archaeon]
MLEHFKIGELYVWDTDDIYGIERSLAAPPGPSLRHGDMFIYLGEAIDQKDPGFIKFKILIKRQVRTATIIEPKADW